MPNRVTYKHSSQAPGGFVFGLDELNAGTSDAAYLRFRRGEPQTALSPSDRPGVDGTEATDLGKRNQTFEMSGIIAGPNEATLKTAKEEITAMKDNEQADLELEFNDAPKETIERVELAALSFDERLGGADVSQFIQRFRITWMSRSGDW